MNAAIPAALIYGATEVLLELMRLRAGQPEGWKPSPTDVANLLAEIDEASPEREKEKARQRLNLPPDVALNPPVNPGG